MKIKTSHTYLIGLLYLDEVVIEDSDIEVESHVYTNDSGHGALIATATLRKEARRDLHGIANVRYLGSRPELPQPIEDRYGKVSTVLQWNPRQVDDYPLYVEHRLYANVSLKGVRKDRQPKKLADHRVKLDARLREEGRGIELVAIEKLRENVAKIIERHNEKVVDDTGRTTVNQLFQWAREHDELKSHREAEAKAQAAYEEARKARIEAEKGAIIGTFDKEGWLSYNGDKLSLPIRETIREGVLKGSNVDDLDLIFLFDDDE